MPGVVPSLFPAHSRASPGSIQRIPGEDVPARWVFWCIQQERAFHANHSLVGTQLPLVPSPGASADQYTPRRDQTGTGQCPSCLPRVSPCNRGAASLVFKGASQSPLTRSPSTSLRCPAQPHTGLRSKPHPENNPDLTPHPPGGWLKTRCFPTLVWRAARRGGREGTSPTHFATGGCWGGSTLPHIPPALPSHGPSRAAMG